MAKRIKQVFSSSAEVFHLWASQSQDHARQGGRITRAFFNDTSCYSYGHHYKVGELVVINGRQVALINTAGYSNTTAKHISEARSAVFHIPVIEVDGSFDWQAGLLKMQDTLINTIFNTLNRHAFWKGVDYTKAEEVDAFNSLCIKVGMPELCFTVDKETTDVINAHVNYRLAREAELKAERLTPEYAAKQAAREQKKAELELKNREAKVQDWLEGGNTRNSEVSFFEPQLVRTNGNELETSRGARIPLETAMLILNRFEKGRLAKGAHVGPYKFDSIKDDVLKIGCHTLSLKQVIETLKKVKSFNQ